MGLKRKTWFKEACIIKGELRKQMLNKTLIIDGSYMLHRALHVPALFDLSTSDGVKSGGVYGFLKTLQSEIRKFPEYFPVVCWDKGLAKRRTDLYPDYKANRKRQKVDEIIAAGGTPEKDEYLEEYHRQRDILISILSSLGVTSLIIPGWEGDDLQYVLTLLSNDCIVVSDDKDMIQLVSPTCKIRRPMKDELIDFSGDNYYHHPRYTIRKSITGDPSDGIPQVASGVGEKTADTIAQLIEHVSEDKYKETLIESIDKVKPALAKKINEVVNNWNRFEINYKLINLRYVEIPESLKSLIRSAIEITSRHVNIFEAYKLVGKYEMATIFPDQIVAITSSSRNNLISV